jgi:hypothetical protein
METKKDNMLHTEKGKFIPNASLNTTDTDNDLYDFDFSEEEATKIPESSAPLRRGFSRGLKIFILFFTVIILGAVSYYLLNPQYWHSGKKSNKEISQAQNAGVIPEKFEPEQKKEQEREILFNNMPAYPEKESKVIGQKVVENSHKIDKWGLKRPCYIISYGAFSVESTAQAEVEKLTKSRFETGYFWIPDYVGQGKELYKVYVGPFVTRADAESRLPDVKKKKSKAYIEKLESD